MIFYPKPFTLPGCLFISSLEKCYFFILLLDIVAQWDYYYRIESMRKCIRSRSPTPTVSKAHNFFLEATILLIVNIVLWNVGFKIRLIGSHFIMFQIVLLMLTFPRPGPKVPISENSSLWVAREMLHVIPEDHYRNECIAWTWKQECETFKPNRVHRIVRDRGEEWETYRKKGPF